MANIFGTLGYLSCLLQWLVVALLYLPALLDNETIKHFLQPEATQPMTPIVADGPPSPILIGFALIFTVFMLIVTIIILVRSPLSLARTGRIITARTAETIVPVITHHRPIPASKKRHLTTQLIKVIKFSLVMMPFLLCYLSIFVQSALAFDIVLFSSAILAIGSLVWFMAQYLSARLLRVPLDKLI